jgi:hypothetical protein
MKYLILIYSNPASRAMWDGFSTDEKAEGLRYYAALNEDLIASGEMIVSEALADPSMGTRLTARDGQALTSDGPFPELKEHLAGFFLVDCASMERAIEVAGLIPEAELGLVEVRPTMTLSSMLT